MQIACRRRNSVNEVLNLSRSTAVDTQIRLAGTARIEESTVLVDRAIHLVQVMSRWGQSSSGSTTSRGSTAWPNRPLNLRIAL